jgi:hypothetical protein
VRSSCVLVLLAACAEAGSDETPGGRADASLDAPLDAAPDADDTDASGPTAVVWVGPDTLFVPRGSTATLGVNLDRPAPPGGTVLTIDSNDPAGHISHTPSVTVPEGQATAQVVVSGVSLGGPIELTVRLGASSREADVRVVPPLMSLVAPRSEIVVGEMMDLTMTLEAAAEVDIEVQVASSNPFLVSAPNGVTIPAGASSATVRVMGMDLGGMVSIAARIGDGAASTPVRVGGLYFSEILYDITSVDDQREWIELYNASSVAIPLAGMRIQVNNGVTSGFTDVMALSGGVAPGACVVVGGPMSGPTAANFTPSGFLYEVTEDFTTDLGNAGDPSDSPPAPSDAIQLVMTGGVILDNVIYGRNNTGAMTDENGLIPSVPDAPDVDPGRSIERTALGVNGPWRQQLTPNPADCSAIAP